MHAAPLGSSTPKMGEGELLDTVGGWRGDSETITGIARRWQGRRYSAPVSTGFPARLKVFGSCARQGTPPASIPRPGVAYQQVVFMLLTS